MTGIFKTRERRERFEPKPRDDHVKLETEIRVMQLPRFSRSSDKPERGKEEFFPRVFRGSRAFLAP